ncbi:hypothetical protein BD309DRAFT_944370 [Dichomitus squalens]|uniref:Uncharacterized protein n=1 Tax=Dichomitus squalens TaxID=114155 RepID=A0A4Q9P7X8_9APHY|nr:hypothetical protein BD309DRAFT_944370 [Dichomitus squalens]TBU65974.1 hypothetical protein BD310DRAFT_912461 [Dichomitus squalens]
MMWMSGSDSKCSGIRTNVRKGRTPGGRTRVQKKRKNRSGAICPTGTKADNDIGRSRSNHLTL